MPFSLLGYGYPLEQPQIGAEFLILYYSDFESRFQDDSSKIGYIPSDSEMPPECVTLPCSGEGCREILSQRRRSPGEGTWGRDGSSQGIVCGAHLPEEGPPFGIEKIKSGSVEKTPMTPEATVNSSECQQALHQLARIIKKSLGG
jgi:hypothetical protein